MSIPLVQEATKDAINTSIIAIKRNIERINMLLGLVDSSGNDPDLSGLATKQELQDAITELTPIDEVTLNNMQSVTSNAVAESLSYIVGQEIKTGGKFFDGDTWKDVYRIVLKTTEFHNVGSWGWAGLQSQVQALNIARFVKCTSLPASNNPYINNLILAETSLGFLTEQAGMAVGSLIILEYTKTTD